jgi:hypothetical protein
VPPSTCKSKTISPSATDESEVIAEKHLAQIGSAEGRAAARAEETTRELAAIDWDDDDPLGAGANTSAAS